MTTEDLLAAIPADEDDKWEKKAAEILTKKGELKKELGKQVSAFANSGGGYLVFGIADKTGIAEPCEQTNGRQSMKDYLSTMTEQSVEQPIRDFRVHRIPFKDDGSKSMFVLEIGDSQAAPHQAKDERQYYYRIDGHSKPAPHFHLELLRSRMTRAFLSIERINWTLQTPTSLSHGRWKTNLLVSVVVKNVSLQVATHWGIHLKSRNVLHTWIDRRTNRPLEKGFCVHAEQTVLLPDETSQVSIHLAGDNPQGHGSRELQSITLMKDFGLSARPVSHDHIGEEETLGYWTEEEWPDIKSTLDMLL